MMKLSIILPCYNVSKYISRCLDTILAIGLSKDEYEILCVDDCSTDNTPDIIRDYQKQYPNLRLIQHTENKACGGARNTGLYAAKGEYIWYIDPDDMIYPQMVMDVLNQCFLEKLDVICFNYEDIDEEEHILEQPKVFKDTEVQSGVAFANNTFGDGILYHIGYVVRFFYKREFLLKNHILFPENTCWQDTVYMPQAILLAERVKGSSALIYRYWHHETSVCGSFAIGYSARKIHQWSFNAGANLFDFSQYLKDIDEHYSILFENFAKDYYVNRFWLFLCRTSFAERNNFYRAIRENSIQIKHVKTQLSNLSSILLFPYVGRVLAECMAIVYKFKTKIIK